MNILFKDIDIITLDGPVIYGGCVLVSDGKIAHVGRELPQGGLIQRVISGRGKFLMPGIFNAHTHIAMTGLRGYADDLPLQTWLFEKIFPVEDRLDPETTGICAALGMAEAIRSGTVSVSDMYFHCDSIARALSDCGLKGNLSRAVVRQGDGPFSPETCESLAESLEFISAWHGHDGGRILTDVAVHAEYTSSPEVWEYAAALAAEKDLGLHFHLSETRAEHEQAKAKYGKTPARLFFDAGLLTPRSLAAHCVWLEPGDIALLAEAGVSVAHNPVSNLKLGSGVAPLRDFLGAGVNVALGTDGVASNNSHNMFEEIKFSALLQKGLAEDPGAVPAETALKMACTNGARAQGRADCGKIAPGMDADLVMLDANSPGLFPVHDPVSAAVYSASPGDVLMTMVRGEILYENGEFKTLDYERVLRDFQKIAAPRLFA